MEKQITFFMLVTERDCIIADYSIKSYGRIYKAESTCGYNHFVLYIYLNCLSAESKKYYLQKWAAYPYTVVFDNIEKMDGIDIKPYPGKPITSPEGITRTCDDYAENYDELWTTEPQKFTTPYIATVDADFEILNPDFFFYLMDRLENDKSLIAASSDYDSTSAAPIYESYSNRNIRIFERNHTWFCIYRKEAFSLSKVSHFYYEDQTGDGEMIAYDSAANFQRDLRKQGFKFIDTPRQYYTSYVHYGSSSKNRSLDRSSIKYYRRIYLLRYKGLIYGNSSLTAKIINKATQLITKALFQNYLKSKSSERAKYVEHANQTA